ncbi:MAG TPA: hypothetical protein VEH80_12145 [Candidatus Bathyarchaeia archaeon]|nr:hypothetical protein [Candidatus Bathyarchaeia archaeon]
MSETSDQLLRGFQAQEKRFLERRFPLRFAPESPALRELYSQAKGLRWNPETDIAWSRFDPFAYAPAVREAARLVWSRRAWGTYPGLAENTALLIRFCLESGAAGMDAKLFLSFRPAEEAKHLEACLLFATRLGGYESTPSHAALARTSNQPFAQMALDPDLPVEAVVAALGCLDDQLDLNLCLGHLQHSRDETARQILRLAAGDKQRHVLFAWTLLAQRLPRLDGNGRAAVADTARDVLERVILAGYRNTWLLPREAREPLLAAEALTAEHGLGASTEAQEQAIVRATVAQVRERLAVWDIALPHVDHPELGRV